MTENEIKKIFDQWHYRLVAYGNSILDNWQDGEDMACEAFVRLWKERDNYSIHTAARFLFLTVKRLCMDRKKHLRRVDSKYDNILEGIEWQTEFDHRTEAAEIKARLLEMIGRLSIRQQQVVTMKYFQYMKVTDIADELGMKVDTVRVQLHRAIGFLRKTVVV